MKNDVKCADCSHAYTEHHAARDGGCGSCGCHRFRDPLAHLARTTVRAFRDMLLPVAPGVMCWEAALAAFGVAVPHDNNARSATWLTQQLELAGWRAHLKPPRSLACGAENEARALTLAVVLPHVVSGDWLLFLDSHVIAARDGMVTDTVGWSHGVRRRVHLVCELEKTGAKPPASCECYDPAVFGHAPGHKQPVGRHGQL